MNVELRYLHAFRTVCEAGGLRAAAAVMHRTEQSVSYQLRRLEESLGMQLFERRGGRLQPNAAGLRLLDFCRGMQHDWERLHDEMRDATLTTDPLRISAVSGYGRYVVLPLFRDGPLADLPIRLHYPTAEGVLRNVESGDSHLGFVYVRQPHAKLQHIPVDREEIVLIAPACRAAPVLDAASLLNESFITYDESDFVFATWFKQVLGIDLPQLSATAHFEELEEVLAWVAAGRGLSIVPAVCLLESPPSSDYVVVRKADAPCLNTIYAVLLRSHTHPLIEPMLDALQVAAAERFQPDDSDATSEGSK
jgi:DNA-binding transcriptional LysR family regulator